MDQNPQAAGAGGAAKVLPEAPGARGAVVPVDELETSQRGGRSDRPHRRRLHLE